MTQTIYVIVNSYNDYEGMAVATDGGAFSTLEKAKEKFMFSKRGENCVGL